MSATALPDGVEIDTGAGGLPVLSVRTPAGTGAVCLRGAHVLAWQPAGSTPVLWTSRDALFAPGEPIRGGIPLCAPWFVFGPSGDREPLHGFVQFVPWRLESVVPVGGADTIRVTLSLTGADADRFAREHGIPGTADYPSDYACQLVVEFGAELSVSWTVRSTGAALEWEQAMHTHLVVDDIRQCRLDGVDQVEYLDKVAGVSRRDQGPVRFAGETDRVYRSVDMVSLVDPGLGRRIVVSRSGSAQVVVWNPWSAKAAQMSDFGDEEWPGMVCVETANVLTETVSLAPGEQHTMSFRLSVHPC